MRAEIDGLSFDEWPRDYDTSYVIEPQGLSGWFGGTSMRRENVERPLAHGAFDARGYQSARLVTVQGNILASSYQQMQAMKARLTGLLADGQDAVMSVDDGHTMTTATVRLASLSGPDETSDDTASFQLQLWAPDPRRYGERRSFQGGVTVTPWHRGNFAAVPRIVVESGFEGGFWLDYAGRVFEVSRRTWWSEAPIEVDMATGWVWQGGSLLRGVITRAETFTIPPAANEPLRLFGIGAGSGRVRVELTDTYI